MRVTGTTLNKAYKAQPTSIDTMQLLGYELIDELFVDSSGLGSDNEPALTASQFERKLAYLINEHGPLEARITGAGMFQVYVGLFKRTGTKKAKKIASNVLLINNDNGTKTIRLYDTDILTDNGDGTLTVNNGGYATRTTHKRINEFSTLWAGAKNFETYINGVNLKDQAIFAGELRVQHGLVSMVNNNKFGAYINSK